MKDPVPPGIAAQTEHFDDQRTIQAPELNGDYLQGLTAIALR